MLEIFLLCEQHLDAVERHLVYMVHQFGCVDTEHLDGDVTIAAGYRIDGGYRSDRGIERRSRRL